MTWGMKFERSCDIRKIKQEENIMVTFTAIAWQKEKNMKGDFYDKPVVEDIASRQYTQDDKQWIKDVIIWVRDGRAPE